MSTNEKFKQIWIREETKKALKIQSTIKGISLVDLVDKMVNEDQSSLAEFIDNEKKRRRGRQFFRDF